VIRAAFSGRNFLQDNNLYTFKETLVQADVALCGKRRVNASLQTFIPRRKRREKY